MEALAEQLIATYLTRGGKVFIAPQYPFLGTRNIRSGLVLISSPSVSRSLGEPEVIIVEVTTAADPANLIRKLKQRENEVA